MPTRHTPLCHACPRCGAKVAKKTRSNRLVSFSGDRRCLRCGKTYTPPTPKWVAWVFGVIGLLILAKTLPALFFSVSALVAPGEGEEATVGWSGVVGIVLVALLGAWCLLQGIRFFREKPLVPPSPGSVAENSGSEPG